MATLEIVSPEEYHQARLTLLAAEKEVTRARTAVSKQRRTLPVTEVTKDYKFTTLDSNNNPKQVSLLDLADGRRQLIVYHFMFDPSWDAGCQHCSVVGDAIPAHLQHIHARSTSLVCVSRAPIEKITAYQKRMGWTFPWFSSHGSDFNYDFRATQDENVKPLDHNFKSTEEIEELKRIGKGHFANPGEQSGVSSFVVGDGEAAGEKGKVYHAYSTYSRGPELVVPYWQWMDLSKFGQRDEFEDHRFDEYSEEDLRRFE